MRNFKRFIAFVLCAVMLVGVMPMAFTGPNAVVAESGAEEGTGASADPQIEAIIQGENDLVVLYDKDDTLLLPNYLVANTTNPGQIGQGLEDISGYDRVIFVFEGGITIPAHNFYASGNSGYESIVLTQKVYVQNPDIVYDITVTNSTTATYTKAQNIAKNEIYNLENLDKAVTLTKKSDGSIPFGCDVEFDYIKLNFQAENTRFYCQGFDLTMGENVEFSYAGDTTSYYPIIMNGSYISGESFHLKGKNGGTSDKLNTQTITLLGGEYQYVSPRSRDSQSSAPSNKHITLNLGNVTFASDLWFAAIDDYSYSTIDVNINGTTFNSFVYVIGSAFTVAGNMTGCTFNIFVNDVSFATSRYFVGFQGISATSDNKRATVSDTKINVYLSEAKHVASKFNIEYTSNAGNLENAPSLADLHTSLYYNPLCVADAETAYEKFDNHYELSVEKSVFNANCGEKGENVYNYVDETGVIKGTWTRSVENELHNYSHYSQDNGEFITTCSKCLSELTAEKLNGKPVVFVNSTLIDDFGNSGFSADSPFETLKNAFNTLAVWGVGGTVVLSGPCYYTVAEDNDGNSNGFSLADAGDTVTITSHFNDVDYREAVDELSGNACWITVDYIKFNNDIIVDSVDLLKTANHKTWFMNYNDLTVTNVRTYEIGNLDNNSPWTDACVPEKGDEIKGTTEEITPTLNISAGSARGDKETAGSKDFGTQTIVLDSGFFHQILSGNKFVNASTFKFGSTINIETDETTKVVEDETPSGTTNIYIGGDAIVDGVDAYTDYESYNITTNIYFENGNTDIMFCEYDGAGYEEIETDGKTVILMSANELPEAKKHITVYSDDYFTQEGFGLREPQNGDYAHGVRVNYSSANLAVDNVTEFGVLMSLAESAENIATYVSAADKAENGVAKSVCFGLGENNYEYDGTNPVVFRGALVFDGDYDTEDNLANTELVAAPYAVIAPTDGDNGAFTVIGTKSVAFSYNYVAELAAAN